MIIGIPKEIKEHEYRVALLPVGAQLLSSDGHTVVVEQGAGAGSGFEDSDYQAAGATVVESAEEVFSRSDMIIKVKEPQPTEIKQLTKNQVVFTYFHFAGSRALTEGCLDREVVAVAYETLADESGRLPLLTPMSEVAGKMSIQEGAKSLEKPTHGRGILLGGIPGVEPAHVLVLGGGVVGANAALVAAGLGANVTVMDIHLDRLRYLSEIMPSNVTTIFSDPHAIEKYLAWADLVVGAVLIPGGRTPRLVRKEHLSLMKKGAALVDVSIDQGGCFETSHPTTHGDPTYIIDDVVHYCVANMPGAVGRTSSLGLCNATLPYCRELAKLGVDGFMQKSPGRARALNMRRGRIAHEAVAEVFGDLPR